MFRREVIQTIDLRENPVRLRARVTAEDCGAALPLYEVASHLGRTYEEGRKSAGATACAPYGASSSTAETRRRPGRFQPSRSVNASSNQVVALTASKRVQLSRAVSRPGIRNFTSLD